MKNLHVAIISLSMAVAPHPGFSATEKTVDDFRGAAAKAKAVLTIPEWEQRAVEGVRGGAHVSF